MIRLVKLFLFLALLSAGANADQTFIVSNNDTIITAFSQREITRISFEEEVASINSIKGELEYDIQGKDIFVRTESKKPVNFFVKTENNNTYKFIASVENIPATQIFIKLAQAEITERSNINYQEDISDDLKTRISKIIYVALHPRKYLGYSITKLDKSLSSPHKNLSMQLIGKLVGNRLIAEKIYITNKSKTTEELNLKDFITKDTTAVYLTRDWLLPKEKCVLIRILEN